MTDRNHKQPEVTFLIPCLNEELSINFVITEINQSFSNSDLIYEILVADNGSTDDSITIARSLGARVINVPSRGYGSALQSGIKHARGRFIVMGDADGSYTFGDSLKMIELLRSGIQLVMGNRFEGNIEKGAMPLLHKYLGNPVLSFIGRLFFKVPIGDFHCGLRAFDRESILKLSLVSPGMEFASEMVVMASKNSLSISETPVTLKQDLRDRPPHLRTWSDGWRHLRFLLAQSPLWAFLVPAGLSFSFAVITALLSLLGPTKTFGVSISYRTAVISNSLALIGAILSWFFLMAKELLQEFDDAVYSRIRKFVPIFILTFLSGLSILVNQYINWYQSGFGEQPLGKELLITIFGGFLLVSGFFSIMSYFLTGMIRNLHEFQKGIRK